MFKNYIIPKPVGNQQCLIVDLTNKLDIFYYHPSSMKPHERHMIDETQSMTPMAVLTQTVNGDHFYRSGQNVAYLISTLQNNFDAQEELAYYKSL